MLAILGEIEFEVAGGLSGMEATQGADYAEHALIAGKPLLESTGDVLDEYRLTIELHPSLGDVAARARALRDAMTAHRPLAFVLGSGDFLGAFVITELLQTQRRTWANGAAFASTLNITLRQWAGEFEVPPLAPAIADSIDAVLDAQPELLRQESPIKTAAMQAFEQAKAAVQTVGEAVRVVDSVKNGDIAAALQQVPSLANVLGRAAPMLSTMTDSVAALQGEFEAASELVQLGGDALAAVQSARNMLSGGVDAANVLAKLAASGQSLESVLGMFEQATKPLAQLAAAVATRRI